jgi:tripartite-type tricarboxylate transporter receptor subunit TctC
MSLIQYKTGAQLTIVPYAGSGSQLTDLIAGNVDFGSGFPISYMAAVAGGQLKFIAQMSDKRAANVPDVPATDESSYKGVYGGGWLGAFVPKGTPKEIVDKIVAEINITMAKPDIQEKIKGLGYIIVPGTPEEFAKKIEGQVAEVKELIDKGVFKVTQ